MAKLTVRQAQILRLIQEGKRNVDIKRELGCADATINSVRKNHADLCDQAASVASVNVANFEDDLVKSLKQTILYIANTLAKKNLQKQSAPQLTTALGTLFDKLRLLENKATNITQTNINDMTKEQRKLLQELSDKYHSDLRSRLKRVK